MTRFILTACILLSLSLPSFSQETTGTHNDSEQETPLDSLYQLLLNELLSITTDKEVLLNGESAIVLSKGTWKDEDVAAYKIKYKRLPIVLPLTKYKQDIEQYEEQKPSSESVEYVSEHQMNRAEAVKQLEEENESLQGSYAQNSGGVQRAETVYTDEQLAQMILHKGKASDVFYLYVSLPSDEKKRQELSDALIVLFEDDFQNDFEDEGFVRLPQVFIPLWKVRLGLSEPHFPGGYN